jgi:hypothetical protein
MSAFWIVDSLCAMMMLVHWRDALISARLLLMAASVIVSRALVA